MLRKAENQRDVIEIVNLDMIAPKELAINPVILIKIVLIQHLYGIVSLHHNVVQ